MDHASNSWTCLAIILGMLLSSTLQAADHSSPEGDETTRSTSAELERILDNLDAANEQFEDLNAQVNYIRSIPLLDEEEKADGQLRFSKPDLLHLKLGEPRNEEIYSDGTTWWVINHEDKQVEVYTSAKGKNNAAEASFLTFGYGKSSESMLQDYVITTDDSEKVQADGETYTAWSLTFTPRKSDAPARFSRIEVRITDRLWLPEALTLHESDGEIVHTFDLHNISLNTDIKPEHFQYAPPRGYSVVKPQR